jgi:hypothetical protein
MSTSFTQKNVAAFLVEQGAAADLASSISSYVVVAVRTSSTGSEIKEQSVNADFTGYNAVLLTGDGSEIKLAYTVKKLGAGFFEHGVNVTHGDQSYGLSNLMHSPLNINVDITDAKAVVEEVEEFVEEVTAEVNEFVEEVKEIFAEEEVAVEAPVVEEVEVEVEVEAPVVEEVAVVEDAPVVEEVVAAAPEAEVKKSKKKAK